MGQSAKEIQELNIGLGKAQKVIQAQGEEIQRMGRAIVELTKIVTKNAIASVDVFERVTALEKSVAPSKTEDTKKVTSENETSS